MHRIPLHLPQPSMSWDRKVPEYKLFEITLNKRNVEETDKFLTILDQETDDYFKLAYNKLADQFNEVPHLLNSKDMEKIQKGMRLLNGVVLRSPKDSPVLPTALKLRGNCFFQKCCFEAASMDYEMFLHVGSQTNDAEELCEVNGSLVICYYLRRQYEKAKERMSAYNKYKALLSTDLLCFQKANLERINRHIENFAAELEHIDDIVPKFREDIYFCIPFKGFNMSEDIPLSSVACTLNPSRNSSSSHNGVYANITIPAGNVVLVEHPIVQSVDKPFVQCEVCLQKKEQIYTCLNCRYKTYCSLKCMLKDDDLHQNECLGYKYLLLLILDASSLYRIFMRISSLLHEYVFIFKSFRKLTTAAAVLETFEAVGDEKHMHGLQYLKLITTSPDYTKLSDMQYSTLVVTAFRLTVFIEKKTMVIDKLYSNLNMCNKQKMILIGALIMRLNCHLLNDTFDFEFNYPLRSKKHVYLTMQQHVEKLSADIKPVSGAVVENLLGHYDIDVEKDIAKNSIELLRSHYVDISSTKSLPNSEHTQSCNYIQRHLSTFKDNIAELYFNPDSTDLFLYGDAAGMPTTKTSAALICSRISEMCDLERSMFVQMFARQFHMHFAEYFLQMNLRHNSIKQVITLLCTTLSKFRHSCAPNVEVVVMENGLVIGKTLQEIKQGEELFISYKAHYMCHTLAERKQFLQNLHLDCSCKCCQMDEIEDVCNRRLGIFCDTCEYSEITPAQGKCPHCQTTYNALIVRYKSETKLFSDELCKQQHKAKRTERDLFITHLMVFNHARKCYVPSNEFRIRIEMEYAKFLALKNFTQQAYEIIVDVREQLLSCYEERFICFTMYADILDVLKIILHYNQNENLYSISNTCLKDLCNFGLRIIKQQLAHIQLYETYDYKCAPILHDLHQFMEWKDQIPCNEFLPIIDASINSKKKKKEKAKAGPDFIPTLST